MTSKQNKHSTTQPHDNRLRRTLYIYIYIILNKINWIKILIWYIIIFTTLQFISWINNGIGADIKRHGDKTEIEWNTNK